MKKNILKSSLLLLLISFATIGLNSCGSKTEEKSTTEDVVTDEPTSMIEEPTANAENGKAIFDTKCIACHKATDEKLIGPGLKGVTAKRTEEWIVKMVKDPADMIANDPEAKKLFEEYKTPMLPLGLTDAEIDDVYAYLKQNDAQ
jgi:mono/diheme cytochrome c family protein